MDAARERHDHQAPEVVSQNFPEAVPTQHYPYANNFQHPQQQWPIGHQQHVLPKPEDGTSTYASGNTPYSVYSGSHADHTSPRTHFANAAPAGQLQSPDEKGHAGGRKKGLVCGFSVLVVALIAAVAVLFVAVVGLAAGTGVEANRANVAEAQLASMSSAATLTATATSSGPTATSTSLAEIDDNCSGDPDGVTGTVYAAFAVIRGARSFTIQCNADAVGNPLMQLFTSDFNTCMDACASWSQDLPSTFAGNSNTTCGAVSFVPAWTDKTVALAGTAPGNCYIKPIQTAVPNTPNIGTPVHAGILRS